MTPYPTRNRSQGHLTSDQKATSVADHRAHTSRFLHKVTCSSSTHHFSKASNLRSHFLQPEQDNAPLLRLPRSKSGSSRWHLGLPVCWGPRGFVLPDGFTGSVEHLELQNLQKILGILESRTLLLESTRAESNSLIGRWRKMRKRYSELEQVTQLVSCRTNTTTANPT